ncbi:MAG: outer membrane protein assembly factor BamE [Hyphomicrobiaceae bacterium]|nr:outer membrane protein assembly factor BamE [Hyphomicrobiaceae bacterium]
MFGDDQDARVRAATGSSLGFPGATARSVMSALALLAGVVSAGCSATTIKHGHYLNENELQQVQPGMSEDTVRMALGTPDTTSALPGGNAYYYISSTKKEAAFFKPEEVDRKVVAVYFNQTGSVTQVANYGMRDGRVFDYVKNETPAHMRDKSFISRFFRGVGPKQKITDD